MNNEYGLRTRRRCDARGDRKEVFPTFSRLAQEGSWHRRGASEKFAVGSWKVNPGALLPAIVETDEQARPEQSHGPRIDFT